MAKDPTFDRRKYPRVMTEALVSIARVESAGVVAHASTARDVPIEVIAFPALMVTAFLTGVRGPSGLPRTRC